MSRFILVVALLVAGCSAVSDLMRTTLTDDQRNAVVERARKVVFESASLSEKDRAIIASQDPKMAYYFLSGIEDAQYSIRWPISESRTVVLSGIGNMLTLVGAKTEIQPNQALEHNDPRRHASCCAPVAPTGIVAHL